MVPFFIRPGRKYRRVDSFFHNLTSSDFTCAREWWLNHLNIFLCSKRFKTLFVSMQHITMRHWNGVKIFCFSDLSHFVLRRLARNCFYSQTILLLLDGFGWIHAERFYQTKQTNNDSACFYLSPREDQIKIFESGDARNSTNVLKMRYGKLFC